MNNNFKVSTIGIFAFIGIYQSFGTVLKKELFELPIEVSSEVLALEPTETYHPWEREFLGFSPLKKFSYLHIDSTAEYESVFGMMPPAMMDWSENHILVLDLGHLPDAYQFKNISIKSKQYGYYDLIKKGDYSVTNTNLEELIVVLEKKNNDTLENDTLKNRYFVVEVPDFDPKAFVNVVISEGA